MDSDGEQVSVRIEPAQDAETGFRHTIYMERISRYLEVRGEQTKNAIESDVNEKTEHIRAGLVELEVDGFVARREGPAPRRGGHVSGPDGIDTRRPARGGAEDRARCATLGSRAGKGRSDYRLSLDASDIVVTSWGTHISTLARETEAIVGGTGHAQNQRLRH
jgi:hypothetical protein